MDVSNISSKGVGFTINFAIYLGQPYAKRVKLPAMIETQLLKFKFLITGVLVNPATCKSSH